MPELQTLNCGHCGAPLEIPTSVNYVTCRFCHNQLHVQRTESIAFTEVVQSLQQETARLADATEVLQLQQRLIHLDNEWERTKHRPAVESDSVPVSRFDVTNVIYGLIGAGAILAFVALISFLLTRYRSLDDMGSVFFPVLLATLIILSLIRHLQVSSRYAQESVTAESRYRSERSHLLAEIARKSAAR